MTSLAVVMFWLGKELGYQVQPPSSRLLLSANHWCSVFLDNLIVLFMSTLRNLGTHLSFFHRTAVGPRDVILDICLLVNFVSFAKELLFRTCMCTKDDSV